MFEKIVPYLSDHEIIPIVMELFDRLYDRRVLVRLIGVRFSELVNGYQQLRLFDEGSERLVKLYNAMDTIRSRFGERAGFRAMGIQATSIGHFNPFNGNSSSFLADGRS